MTAEGMVAAGGEAGLLGRPGGAAMGGLAAVVAALGTASPPAAENDALPAGETVRWIGAEPVVLKSQGITGGVPEGRAPGHRLPCPPACSPLLLALAALPRLPLPPSAAPSGASPSAKSAAGEWVGGQERSGQFGNSNSKRRSSTAPVSCQQQKATAGAGRSADSAGRAGLKLLTRCDCMLNPPLPLPPARGVCAVILPMLSSICGSAVEAQFLQ